MNFSTLAGLFGGLIITLGTVLLSAGNARIFFDLPGLAIVFGGTIAVSLISFPGRELVRLAQVIWVVLQRDRIDLSGSILRIQQLSTIASREGLDALEQVIEKTPPSFLRDGLEMVVDQVHPDEILAVLERRLELTFERELNEAKMLRTLGKLAPSLGMIGTTIGLISMMANMNVNGFARVGMGLATALTTTFYGLLMAHMIFNPLANRLEQRAEERLVEQRLITEGILLLARRVPPSLVLNRLQAYVPPRMWTQPETSSTFSKQPLRRVQ